MLNNNVVIDIFSIKLKYFSKKSYLTTHLAKQNFMLHVMNFKKGTGTMPVLLHGFLLRQIFKIRHPSTTFLRKINAQLPHQLNNLELFELVKTWSL